MLRVKMRFDDRPSSSTVRSVYAQLASGATISDRTITQTLYTVHTASDAYDVAKF